jgi:cytochrome c oxidase subunit I+III
VRDYDEGRFYLPDAEEGRREMLVTTPIDARPIQCLRVPGASFVTLFAALFTGGFFIFGTFHQWTLAAASALLALATILGWLWTGTASIPEKDDKDVGLGLRLPLYASGPASVGWWAMFITMLADLTAFISLVFGYFYFWTVHADFPPRSAPAPAAGWTLASLLLLVGAWALTALARGWNRRDARVAFHGGLVSAAALAGAGVAALLAAVSAPGLDPTRHAYAATVWVLVVWTAVHVGLGVVMHFYCIARRAAGRMTGRYDIDIHNVALYWHFAVLMVVVTVAVIAGFPLSA